MKVSSIDIGTNTIRLLIGQIINNKLVTIIHERRIARLGGSFDNIVGLNEKSMDRAVSALKEFKEIIEKENVEEVHVTATSVVRRANNKQVFLDKVKDKTGLEIEIIEGVSEAKKSMLGVLSVLNDTDKPSFLIDVGGGSTEFIYTKNNEVIKSWSQELLGVVHFTEKYLKSDPTIEREVYAIKKDVTEMVREVKENFNLEEGTVFVATAGTATTLASIDLKMDKYDAEKINNHKVDIEKIEEILDFLKSKTLKERRDILSLEKGREDLIIAGIIITLSVMDIFNFESMTVSDAGLLEGILIEKYLS